MAYEVLAIRYGTRETTKSALYYRYHAYGEPDAPMRMDYFLWVLRDADRVVLVDTGYDVAAGERRRRTTLCPPLEALERAGVEPASVERIILTHLHYAHTGSLVAFPATPLIVHRRELEFWSSPLAARSQLAPLIEPDEIGLVTAAVRDGRATVLEDETVIVAPGVEAIRVGGHSPGQLVLVVDAANPVVLASDALHYDEELELDRPFDVVVDLAEMYRGYDTLRELAAQPGAVLVPGHDPSVCERFPGDEDGIVYRIA
jgi:glyoxylase-like metal-dependent hydrolase (beta-lactamase superfamily II)